MCEREGDREGAREGYMSNCCCCWALCLVHFEATAATPGGRVAKLASARSVLGFGNGESGMGTRGGRSLSRFTMFCIVSGAPEAPCTACKVIK